MDQLVAQYVDAMTGAPYGPVWKNDVPTEQLCKLADPALWDFFVDAYKFVYDREPVWFDWAETEVHQWIDLNTDAYSKMYDR